MKKSQKGFTLVELIVVIAIIGVLAAILVPAMVGYIRDSKFTSANANAKTIYNAVMAFAQKCETAGAKMCDTDDIATATLTVADPSDTQPKVSTIKGAAPSGGLSSATETEVAVAVNNSLGEEAKDSVYRIKFNKTGFPTDVAWAKSASDDVVGYYPAPEDNELTSGFIAAPNW